MCVYVVILCLYLRWITFRQQATTTTTKKATKLVQNNMYKQYGPAILSYSLALESIFSSFFFLSRLLFVVSFVCEAAIFLFFISFISLNPNVIFVCTSECVKKIDTFTFHTFRQLLQTISFTIFLFFDLFLNRKYFFFFRLHINFFFTHPEWEQ